MANPEKAILLGEGEDFLWQRPVQLPEKKAPLTLPDIPIPTNLTIPPIEEKLKFSQKEWIIRCSAHGINHCGLVCGNPICVEDFLTRAITREEFVHTISVTHYPGT